MPFEYIKRADVVSSHLSYWGSGLAIACLLLIIFIVVKQKPNVYYLIVVALSFPSGWFFFQSHQLKQSPGEWNIRVENGNIDWLSPNDNIDSSFSVLLSEIEYIDQSAKPNQSDQSKDYRLILNNGSVIKLNGISGIDLDNFATYLQGQGISIKQTGKYTKDTEQRPK